jgi:hypoxanthine phosphoribosyltransferase
MTVGRLAKDIQVDYHKKDLLMIIVLKGAFVFGSDLIRCMSKPNLYVDFISASSYKGLVTTGEVKFDRLPLNEAHDKHVLVVEDIVDTGRTCLAIRDKMLVANPASLKFCTLLDKPSRREVKFEADYVGLSIPNRFVIGYGLDFGGKYRNLPDIYTMEGK